MIQRRASRRQLVDDFFMGKSNVHQTVEKLSVALRELDLPFAISGALAVDHYGHLRATIDVVLLILGEDLATFKAKYIGSGWLNKFEGPKGFRDTLTETPIDVLITGNYPGDGKPKPVSFPNPREAAEFDDNGIPYLRLTSLIELKLASGMTAPDRPRDLDDVIQLIRKNKLPREYADQLNPYVHESWYRLWDAAQHSDEY